MHRVSYVMHRKKSISDFSGTTCLRILKFGTKLGNDKLCCVLRKQQHTAYHSLYLFIFFLSKNESNISQEVET